MELQDAPVNYLFKLWPKIEANWIRIAWGGGIVVVAILVISFYSWQQGQNEITAGTALTQLVLSTSRNVPASQQADLFLHLATQYPSTGAGQRAWLQGAAMMFAMGRYADAQIQFQKFVDAHPDSMLAAQAALGVGTCLDALGNADMAAAFYQQIIKKYSDVVAVTSARFALAQIDERQGKLAEAAGLYQDIARNNPNGSLGSEAGLRAMELKMKTQSTAPAPATTPTVPFKLN